jgi:hypothetical protein
MIGWHRSASFKQPRVLTLDYAPRPAEQQRRRARQDNSPISKIDANDNARSAAGHAAINNSNLHRLCDINFNARMRRQIGPCFITLQMHYKRLHVKLLI